MIHGISVILYEKTQTGTDPFGEPIYEENPITVDNVLVAPLSAVEVLESINLTGKKIEYQLGIPKGDTHDWTDKTVEFFGEKWHTVAVPVKGIDDLVPTAWNAKVSVERCE